MTPEQPPRPESAEEKLNTLQKFLADTETEKSALTSKTQERKISDLLVEKPVEKGKEKPILERFGEMNTDQLVDYFQSIRTLSSASIIDRMIEENKNKDSKTGKSGITQETLRMALRRVTTKVPSPNEVGILLEKIKNNK